MSEDSVLKNGTGEVGRVDVGGAADSNTDHYYDGNGGGEVGRVDVGGAANSNTDHYYDGIMSNIYDIFYEPTQAFGYYNEWSYEQLHQSIQVRLF